MAAMVIREPAGGARPTMQVGSNVASFSSPLLLDGKPHAFQLPEDVNYFANRSDETLAVWLQWHTIVVLILIHFFTSYYIILTFFKQILTLLGQAVQLAYMVKDKLKDITEEADKERALKDIAKATAKEKVTDTESAEARSQGVERDQA